MLIYLGVFVLGVLVGAGVMLRLWQDDRIALRRGVEQAQGRPSKNP